MEECPLDLHLDEDMRFALSDEEMNERMNKFKNLEEQTKEYIRHEKKVNSEIKRLTSRLDSAKKSSTKKSLTKKIETLQASLKKDFSLMTVAEAKKNNRLYDLRYNPGEELVSGEVESVVGSFRVSTNENDFYFKNEDIIKSLQLFNPENPPSLYEKLSKARREYRLRMGVKNNTFYEDSILSRVSLAGWVKAIARVSRTIPTLVQLIDNELNLISKNPEELSLNGFSTVRLLERFTSRIKLKEQYLNLFVLGKEFEKCLKNKFEHQVYDCFLKKSKKVKNTISPSRVRTAYRYRSVLVGKIKTRCQKLGYTREWFIEHFGDLPPIKKLLIVEFEREAQRMKENLDRVYPISKNPLIDWSDPELAKKQCASLDADRMDLVKMRMLNSRPWEAFHMTREEFLGE